MPASVLARLRRQVPPDLGSADLLVVRTALAAGASPVEALTATAAPVLVPVRAALAAGITLPVLAAMVRDLGPNGAPPEEVTDGSTVVLPSAAAALVRVLGMATAVGAPASVAVDTVMGAVSAAGRLDRQIRIRSAQALSSARVLVVFPLAVAGLLSAIDRSARSFLTSPVGLAVAATATLLIVAATAWMRRMVRAVGVAGDRSDPLTAAQPDRWRARTHTPAGLPTVAALDLIALGLSAGVGLHDATRLAARMAPPPVRMTLRGVAGRLAVGQHGRAAFPDELAEVGRVVEVGERWGAPIADAIRQLADEVRDRAAAAAEEEAERLTVRLVFPTTLLLVPAFGLLVVTPMAASLLGGLVG